jgi:formylglycine-generating enzyme required for sulfatase activity
MRGRALVALVLSTIPFTAPVFASKSIATEPPLYLHLDARTLGLEKVHPDAYVNLKEVTFDTFDVEVYLGGGSGGGMAAMGYAQLAYTCPGWIIGLERGFDAAKFPEDTSGPYRGPKKGQIVFYRLGLGKDVFGDETRNILNFSSSRADGTLRYLCSKAPFYKRLTEIEDYGVWRDAPPTAWGLRELLNQFLSQYRDGRLSGEAIRRLKELPEATAKPKLGRRFKDCSTCPEMIEIHEGSFVMGTPAGTELDLRPTETDGKARVVIFDRRLALGVTHVTRGQYSEFVEATGYKSGDKCGDKKGLNWLDPGFPQADDHPVVCVSWDDARAYTKWLSNKTGKKYFLPTSEQLEYAIHGGSATLSWWGDLPEDACKYANVGDKELEKVRGKGLHYHECNDGFAYTSPVGTYPANGVGIFDAIGNANQWTSDCGKPHQHFNVRAQDNWSSQECPFAWTKGSSWIASQSRARLGHRSLFQAASRNDGTGFRVARDIP